MIPKYKFGVYGIQDILSPIIEEIFISIEGIYHISTLVDLEHFIEDPEYPGGKILIANLNLLSDSKEIWSKLEGALKFATFHLILIQTNENVVSTQTFIDKPNIHFIKSIPYDFSDLTHHFYGLKASLESVWLRSTITYILNCYEQIYPGESNYIEKIEDFILDIVEEIKADSIHIFFLQTATDEFIPEIGYGDQLFNSLPGIAAKDLLSFEETCLTYTDSSPELEKLLSVVLSSEKRPLLSVLTTFKLDGDPGFIIYAFEQRYDPIFTWHVCSVASRELFHLLRSKEIRFQYETLKMLTTIQHLELGRREIIWQALDYLQEFFKAGGTTIVEKIGTENNEYKFEKTYIHRSQKAFETFQGGRGLADYCLHHNKALLIIDSLHHENLPYIEGLAFDPQQIRAGYGEIVKIEYIITQKTVEPELCMMYYPLKVEGRDLGVIKIGDFDNPKAFDIRQLRALSVFAEPIIALLQNTGSVAQLMSKVEKKEDQKKMLEQAEILFFYREIALGIFHQASNYLQSIGSSLVKADILSTRLLGKDAELHELVDKSRNLAKLSMDLIHKAQKRGRNLTPISQKCQLLQEVVRPAIHYAKKRAEETGISIETALTNRDYTVYLDPDLAKESLINLLNNAISAIKEHTRTSKKHIFIGVREISEDQTVKITIEDSGIGIEPDKFPELFMPFFTTRSDGTGLGLYFARRLVEHFGGTVKITKSIPGKGTTAVVTFPLMET